MNCANGHKPSGKPLLRRRDFLALGSAGLLTPPRCVAISTPTGSSNTCP